MMMMIKFNLEVTHPLKIADLTHFVTSRGLSAIALLCHPNNMCFCTTWQNVETRKSNFFTQMYQCIAGIQLVTSFFQSFLTHDSYSRCCMTP